MCLVTCATWSKCVTLITQQAPIRKPSHPEILDIITDWPKGKDFGVSPEEEMMLFEEAPIYNELHIAAQVEKWVFKLCHKSGGNEEHDQQMDQAANIEITQMGLGWQRKD